MRPFGRLFSWYFKRNALPYWIILFLDCFIIFVSAFFIFWVIYRGSYTQLHFYTLVYIPLAYIVVALPFFRIFSTYAGIVRYSSFNDLMRVAQANTLAMVTLIILHYGSQYLFGYENEHISTTHIVTTFILTTMFMGTMRVLVKILYDVVSDKERARATLIYGINEGGISLAKAIRDQRPVRFVLHGFINPTRMRSQHILMGKKVYGEADEILTAIKKYGIKAILVSPIQKDKFRNDPDLQDLLISHDVTIYMVEQQLREQGTEETNNKSEADFSLKEVNVEDLLPRDEISVDMRLIAQELTGKRILITGSAGSIGSEIVRQVAACHPEALMLIDQAETPEHDIRLMMHKDFGDVKAETIVTSICNQPRMERIFNDFRPHYVFHAAAYKHVPMMEDNPSEAIHNNVYGTKVVADLSVKYGAKKFVMISTDKAVNPTNVMGCSKRICEIYVQSLDRQLKMEKWQNKSKEESIQFITTRFGNVLGSNGSVIPLFREQIKNGGPVTVTDPNIIRFFMLIPEACNLVLEAGTKGNGGEIFVFDMGKPVRIADLAKRMIRLSGAQNVQIEYTGLRAGEKLYEEVLNEEENTKPTFNSKIFIANVREYDFNEVSKSIHELIAIAQNYDDMATVKKMKEIVPEFKSNNSKYEVLDNKN
ncbi:MAG: polysaccharide biosynthesis protein [Bacteroidaceae bacterium]|nr:polysaccharide biosynthesis protein [Bacteroidaceae bacterium]